MSSADAPILELLPAVDIVDGRAVQLVQGVAGSGGEFGDPYEAAKRWQDPVSYTHLDVYKRQALASLSQREHEVLAELLQGHYNKNIADHLGITQRTVEFHRANIFEKLGVTSAVELAHQLGKLQASAHGLP